MSQQQPEPTLSYTVNEFAALCGMFAKVGWEAHALADQSTPPPTFAFTPTETDPVERTAEAISAFVAALRGDPITALAMRGLTLRTAIVDPPASKAAA